MHAFTQIRGLRLLAAIILSSAILWGCGARDEPPEEFPKVDLGMNHAETRETMTASGGRVTEDTDRLMSIVERDPRVSEETFFFYHDKLAAWTARYGEEATRRSFQRLARRITLAYGDPLEESDDGWVLRATWRIPDGGARLLLSGYVGSRGPETPLTARLEDPSVMPRLIRAMRREGVRETEDGVEE
jgi:hypothetical protein